MSIGELKRYIRNKNFDKIILTNTDSEINYIAVSSVTFNIEFDSIYIEISPPAICLKCKTGTVSFELVKEIEIEECDDSTIIRFICMSCGKKNACIIMLK